MPMMLITVRKRTYCKNAEALVVTTKETGPEVKADKPNYMVISRE